MIAIEALRLGRQLKVGLALLVLVAASCASASAPLDSASAAADSAAADSADDSAVEPTQVPAPTTAPPTPTPVPELALNHIQVLGSHNSYHLVPEPALFAALVATSQELADSIEYSHLSLTEQLEDFGIRQFELDVFADPDGGLYTTPAVNPLVGLGELDDPLLQEPGFKVLHTQDFDYGSSCLTLVECLAEIESWSSSNPSHLPIMIMLEVKSQSVPEAAAEAGLELAVDLPWTIPVATTPELLEALDVEIRSVFNPAKLIEPDEIRGDAATLEEAVLSQGWPSLDDSRGRVLFTMTNGGSVRDLYIADTPSLEGRPIFTNSTPGQPDAAFVQFNDPTASGLRAAVIAGYLVRTRTDVPTSTARANDPSQRDAAFESGAHFLSTDYYAPSELFDSPYVVELPGGAMARCNPVNSPTSCSSGELGE